MAHKLSEKVINPFSIEKTIVRLADACFHESTIKALEYFRDHGYPHFSPTAEILQVIRNWWNIMNVKSRYIGINKRDRKREEIDDENCESIQYLRDVADWFESWHSQNPSNGLTRETFHGVKHTTLAMIELVQYLLNTKNEINFVLLGLIQSDFLEGRFGWYRQLNGGNYYASVLQFLQAEKTIRLRSLVEFGSNMSAIDAICSEVKENEVLKDENDTTNLMHEITDISFEEDTSISDSEQAIVYYVAGYIARSLRKPIKCNACCFLLSPGESIQISFEDGSISKKEIEAKEEFLALMSRGGLLKPSDILYITCVHASQLFDVLQKNGLLTSLNNPRNVFLRFLNLNF